MPGSGRGRVLCSGVVGSWCLGFGPGALVGALGCCGQGLSTLPCLPRHSLRLEGPPGVPHSDSSKKRLIEDTEDWRPRTGTTQSRSFRILAQLTGTEFSKCLWLLPSLAPRTPSAGAEGSALPTGALRRGPPALPSSQGWWSLRGPSLAPGHRAQAPLADSDSAVLFLFRSLLSARP